MRAWMTPSNLLHAVPAGFPEIPERLLWADSACRSAGVVPEVPSQAELARIGGLESIELVHPDDRLARLRDAAVPWRARLDTPDCPVSPGTPEAALHAAQTTLIALDEVIRGGDSGIALVRPPGHHATRSLALGFCYINNLAVAVVEARRCGCRRAAILDVDVHHGNGTQDIFYEDGEVFFCSMHEDPGSQFPGTGYPEEQGKGEGLGKTLNLPFSTGTNGGPWMASFHDQALRGLYDHRPEILFVSAGFDTHRADPLGGLLLEEPEFRRMGRELGALVRSLSIPALLVLEGGYDPLCYSHGLRPMLEGWHAGEQPEA
jgi:acetoin utilization deacetylase AcuC-like enzyme